MLGHVLHRRALDARRDVVPADAAARAMVRRVVGIAAVDREVDPADVCDPVVDHDHLLVMTVRGAGARVERRLDLRVPRQRLLHLRERLRVRPEGRDRGAFPEEHAHVDPLRELASSVLTTSGSSSRLSASSGERNQPVMWTCDVAAAMSAAMRGSASEPSISTSSALPVAGWRRRRARTRGSRHRAHAPGRRAAAAAGGVPRSSGRCRGRATWPILTVASSRKRGGRSWPATESAGPGKRPLAGASSPGGMLRHGVQHDARATKRGGRAHRDRRLRGRSRAG